MPLEIKVNQRPKFLYGDLVQDKLEKLWPNLHYAKPPYDAALIDLPLLGPKFFGKLIPYPTQPIFVFVFFRFVLE